MPIYVYMCDNENCGHHMEQPKEGNKPLEVFQNFSDPKLEACPSCGTGKLERMVVPTSFILKGGGWFRDGYNK